MSTPVSAPSEMAFFSLLAREGSLSATARELDVTTPAVSKRLAQMESRLGVQLMNRTTRRIPRKGPKPRASPKRAFAFP